MQTSTLKGPYTDRLTLICLTLSLLSKDTWLKNSKKSSFMGRNAKSCKNSYACSQKLSNDSKTLSQKMGIASKVGLKKLAMAPEL